MDNPFYFFTDAVLRAPTIGSMLMCFSAALVGVIPFLRKQSLLGETLSHAAYPGVICGMLVAATLFSSYSFFYGPYEEFVLSFLVLFGAFVTILLSLFCITFLERKLNVASDSALCFVLSVFFGVGLTLASSMQFTHTSFYNKIQVYLYGQAATMRDVHIIIYSLLSIAIVLGLFLLHKELHVMLFDMDFARSIGIKTKHIDVWLFILIVLAVVIGIRSIGVILMSAMLMGPAVAARQYTNKLHILFILAGFFGLLSGFLGNYLSVEISQFFMISSETSAQRISIPTGPSIILVIAALCLFAMLFAPERGLMVRLFRVVKFRYRCITENILKSIWRFDPDQGIDFDELFRYQSISSLYLRFILYRLKRNGWVYQSEDQKIALTYDGKQRAARIIRLHRLWEVYLADYLGVGTEKVHRNAEEMEHIITPELEKSLTELLRDPKLDPHHQPIPPQRTL